MAKPADGMTPLERLIEKDAILDLKARRDYYVDIKDWAAYAALHAPEHVSENLSSGRAAGAEAVTAQLAKNLADIVTVHHSHGPIIEFQDSENATGIWGLDDNQLWRENGELKVLWGAGYYHERYVKRDGKWLFINRRLDRQHVTVPEGTKRSHLAFDETAELAKSAAQDATTREQ
jgi:hypothetical protein